MAERKRGFFKMMGLTFEDIVDRIKEEKGISESEIIERIREKMSKLSGLISNEGAAHIVANELGINLMESVRRKGVKIKRLVNGMSGVTLIGKVLNVYGVREYRKENKIGKVGTFLFGDESGVIRAVIWDINLLSFMEKGEICESKVLRIMDGYVRENNGFLEFHVGSQGKIDFLEQEINVVSAKDYNLKKIDEFSAGDFGVGVFGTVVQVFEPRFFEACPECMKKISNNSCEMHGNVIGKITPVLNLFFDDGTGSIRAVAFREKVLEVLNLNEERLNEIRENIGLFEDVRRELLGKQVIFVGNVVRNQIYDRLEFSLNKMVEVDPKKMAEELGKGIEVEN